MANLLQVSTAFGRAIPFPANLDLDVRFTHETIYVPPHIEANALPMSKDNGGYAVVVPMSY